MISVTRRHRACSVAAAALVAAAVMATAGLLDAPAAHATAAAATSSGRPVQFSDDGIHWSDSYSSALFGGVLLVPGGSVDRVFYVRNNSDQSAALRVTLYGVAATDTDLAAAMTLSTSMPGRPGAAVPITDARPCATLSQGQVLAAGDGVRLDNVAALADLSGAAGQARAVSFQLAISLSSTDSAAPQPNSCPTDFDNTVIGSPDPGPGTASHPVYRLGAGGWTPSPGTASAPGATPTPTVQADPGLPGAAVHSLATNTERLYQENIVALWLAMTLLGGLIFVVVRRRRRDDDAAIDYPNTHHKIGIGR